MPKQPNVIVITTDQQRKDSIGSYGSTFVNTPHMDSMAENGLKFNRAYCTNPVCTPSRASIMTGRYTSHHGAWNIGMNISEFQPFIAEIFKEHGYRTHLIGKCHLNAAQVPPGQSKEPGQQWEEYYRHFHGPYLGFETVELSVGHTNFGIKGHYGLWAEEKCGQKEFASYRKSSTEFGAEAYDWDIPMEIHNNTWVAERTRAFIQDKAKSGEPFFLNVGFEDPHHPHCLPKEIADTITDEDIQKMPLPKYTEGELDDKPPHFAAVRAGEWSEHPLQGSYGLSGQQQGFDYTKVSNEDARLAKAYYYKMVEMIDKAMGEILEELDHLGLAEDTIVVFTSDHGELLGDHGLWMKGPLHYESLINIPLMVQWKNHLSHGKSIDSIFSLVDLAPTLLSLCRITVPLEMDGKDASALWRGDKKIVRQMAMVEYCDEPEKLRLKTVITDRYKLTYYTQQSYGELYDLKMDPDEIVNLWDDARYQQIKNELLLRMMDELEVLEVREKRISFA